MEAGLPLHHQYISREEPGTTLTPQHLYRRDPLLVLLKDKWRLNHFWFITSSFLFTVVCFFGLHALAAEPFTPRITLIRVLDVFTVLLFYGVYFCLPHSIANLFNTLIDNRVVGKPLKDQPNSISYEGFLSTFITWMNSSLWLLLTLPFVIAFPLYRLLGLQLSAMPSPFWLLLPGAVIDFSIGYVSVLSIVRISLALFFLYRLLQSFPIHINPLHADGVGGLGVLRQILWSSAGIMLGVALAFYEDSISASRAVDIGLLTLAYAILIPSLLIGWLILPHRAMLRARQAILQPLTDEYDKVVSEMKAVSAEDTAAIVAGTERLSVLTQRYELWCNTFPVWPLEVVQMRQLLLVFILPVLVAFISIIPAIPSIIDYFMKRP